MIYVHVMFFVYIMASKRNGTIYLGHTDDLGERVTQHKVGAFEGFSKKYGCKTLVWFEVHETRDTAFLRERQMKKWKRSWKIHQIEKLNPNWEDLLDSMTYDDLYHPDRIYTPPPLIPAQAGIQE